MRRDDDLLSSWNLGQRPPNVDTMYIHKTKMFRAALRIVSWTQDPGMSALRSFTT